MSLQFSPNMSITTCEPCEIRIYGFTDREKSEWIARHEIEAHREELS